MDCPITEWEIRNAFPAALNKLQRIKGRTGAEYDFDYFLELLREQIIEGRYSQETVERYKKRHAPKNAPNDKYSISEFSMIVKEGFLNV